MSEMFRPAPLPAAPDHEEHDPLLVAQLAAGDPLDPARAQQAQRWLASCPACARLAADLRAVSAAVAAEPVPPRRRDFRLTPEQAESLSGNALTRFLRRLALPQARGFAPAAAGILSLGLVFMVAGYAWPDDGAVSVGTDAVPASAPVAERSVDIAASVAPLENRQPLTQAAPAVEPETPLAADDATSYFASEPEALEGLAEHQAGTSARSKTTLEEAEAAVEAAEAAAAPDLVDRARESDAAVAGASAQDAAAAAQDRTGVDSADRLEAGAELSVSATADGGSSDEIGVAVDSVGDDLDDDTGLGRWLILVGVVLAGGGGALLVLGWLSRRSRDPLLYG